MSTIICTIYKAKAGVEVNRAGPDGVEVEGQDQMGWSPRPVIATPPQSHIEKKSQCSQALSW